MTASFQDVADAVAKVVGGNAPDAVNRPRWFSGLENGDTSGLQVAYGPAFVGCYSAPPESLSDFPVGVVMVGPFEITSAQGGDVYIQGEEINRDDLRLLILLGRGESESTMTNLNQFRDLVPAAFAAHMGIFATANVLQAFPKGGRPVVYNDWGGNRYVGIQFDIRVIRIISRSYAA